MIINPSVFISEIFFKMGTTFSFDLVPQVFVKATQLNASNIILVLHPQPLQTCSIILSLTERAAHEGTFVEIGCSRSGLPREG